MDQLEVSLFLRGTIAGVALALPLGAASFITIFWARYYGFQAGSQSASGLILADMIMVISTGILLFFLPDLSVENTSRVQLISGMAILLIAAKKYFEESLEEISKPEKIFWDTFKVTIFNFSIIFSVYFLITIIGGSVFINAGYKKLFFFMGMGIGEMVWWIFFLLLITIKKKKGSTLSLLSIKKWIVFFITLSGIALIIKSF